MPFIVRYDPVKNCLHTKLVGFITDDLAKKHADEFIAALDQVRSGFDMISDITEFKPGSPYAVTQLERAQVEAKKRGLRRMVRIVGASVIAKMQVQRASEETGLSDVRYASSMAEAEELLRA